MKRSEEEYSFMKCLYLIFMTENLIVQSKRKIIRHKDFWQA
jgi:hypothetical protein